MELCLLKNCRKKDEKIVKKEKKVINVRRRQSSDPTAKWNKTFGEIDGEGKTECRTEGGEENKCLLLKRICDNSSIKN